MERMTPEQAAAVGKAERGAMSAREAQALAVEDRVLRQWCVEKAISAIAAAAPYGNYSPNPVEEIAAEIYDFIASKKERP